MSAEMSAEMSGLETKTNELIITDEKTVDGVEPVFSLDEDDKKTEITLITMGGHKLKITKQNAMISKLLAQIIESDPNAEEIPLPQVTQRTLSLILEYANHHAGVPQEILEMPLKSTKMSENCKHKWDAEFIDRIGDQSRKSLYDLIKGANYMDIKCLLHLGSAKVASWIKGVPLETIKVRLDDHGEVDPEKAEFESKSSGVQAALESSGQNASCGSDYTGSSSSSDAKNDSVETKVASTSVEPATVEMTNAEQEAPVSADTMTDTCETTTQPSVDETETSIPDTQMTTAEADEPEADPQLANEEPDPLTIHS